MTQDYGKSRCDYWHKPKLSNCERFLIVRREAHDEKYSDKRKNTYFVFMMPHEKDMAWDFWKRMIERKKEKEDERERSAK